MYMNVRSAYVTQAIVHWHVEAVQVHARGRACRLSEIPVAYCGFQWRADIARAERRVHGFHEMPQVLRADCAGRVVSEQGRQLRFRFCFICHYTITYFWLALGVLASVVTVSTPVA